jgi:copper(I)-binding protein
MKTCFLALPFILSAGAAAAGGTATAGGIAVEDAWSRATIGASRPGVAYLTIRNEGAEDDALLSIATPAAAMPMLHETVVTNGVATMPHVTSIPVPAGGTVALEPGGFHAMLMDLAAPLEEGATFPVTLTFETAGEVTVEAEVLSLAAQSPDC